MRFYSYTPDSEIWHGTVAVPLVNQNRYNKNIWTMPVYQCTTCCAGVFVEVIQHHEPRPTAPQAVKQFISTYAAIGHWRTASKQTNGLNHLVNRNPCVLLRSASVKKER